MNNQTYCSSTVLAWREILAAAHAGEQAPGISYIRHGEQVAEKLMALIANLGKNGDWTDLITIDDLRLEMLSFHNMKNKDLVEQISTYAIYHDIGKPFCLEIDADGKKHYPNHSEVSQALWNSNFDEPYISYLILHDMDIHVLKPINAADWAKTNQAPLTLLLSAMASIQANCEMFGGISSDSYKIKKKKLASNAKRIIQTLKEQHV